MISSLESIDWYRFLDRDPLRPASAPGAVASRRKPILITGAGGSIGSALALRLARDGAELILLESSEAGLHELHGDLPKFIGRARQFFYLGSAGDRELLLEILERHEPGVVFHTAAFKHVPLLEQQPLAAITNNVFGTLAVTESAAEHESRVVLLSTDKAVEPCSVMGATKRVAEQIVLDKSGQVVRLANVIESRGSVSEVFARQIANGHTLTVTDAAAERYFITLAEAVGLLMAASDNSERSSILVPRLERSHRISKLANFMAATLAPGREIAIEFTGLRAGEKLSEKLVADDEIRTESPEGAMFLIEPQKRISSLRESLEELEKGVMRRDLTASLSLLRELVPHYQPSGAVLSRANESTVLHE